MADLAPVAPRMPTPPRKPLPSEACDTHAHVFGPYERFAFTGPSNYTPPLAPPPIYEEMLGRIGAERGVLIQPAPYGTDHGALLNALLRRPTSLRGVAVAPSTVSDRELAELDAAGVRGLRFNEMRNPTGGGRYSGSVGIEDYRSLAPRMKELGWHPHIWAKCADLADILPSILPLGLPVVIDHLAGVDVERGPQDPAFRRIVELLGDGKIWIKLSLCRNSTLYPDYQDERPFHDALVAANPDRLLWGSDWPFVRMGERSPDAGHLIDLFDAWIGDEAIRQKVFVANPAALYGF